MNLPIVKSCHMISCTEKHRCAVFEVKPTTAHVLRVSPLHPYPHCDFYQTKVTTPDVDDLQERIMRMAGCLK